jgi:arsenite methyltransferase
VLRPGGLALISDFRETALYAAAFREADFHVERSRLGLFDTYPPMRILTARKPAA